MAGTIIKHKRLCHPFRRTLSLMYIISKLLNKPLNKLDYKIGVDSNYVAPMIVGKLVSGICAVVLALLIYKGDTNE